MTSTYRPTWDSLTEHNVPQWFSISKLACTSIGAFTACRASATNGMASGEFRFDESAQFPPPFGSIDSRIA